MKNLKKVLALVTVVAVLLTCVPAVFASQYSDVADNASYAEAIEMLSKLGIFTGYEDGTFKPDKTITRAEAAAAVTRFLAQEDTAKAMAGSTIFTDMDQATWATGYVNFGVQKGYINGMGDGTFHPNDPVTYEQIVKMIVAALGYTLKAEDQGGYPSGYLSVASQTEITKGTSGSNGAAPRGVVARLIYNALDVQKMEISKYISNGDKEYTEYGNTVLKDDHKVDKYDAVIENSTMIDMDSAKDDKAVTMYCYKKGLSTYGGTWYTYDGDDDNPVRVMVGDSDALNYVGYRVTAYVREDDETGEDTIIAITPKSNKNDVLTVSAANIDHYASKIVYYWKNKDSDKKASEIELNAPTVIKNNETKGVNANALNDNDLDGVVTFISNDGNTNNGYEFVIISSYDEEFVIDKIDSDNYIVEAKSDSITGSNGEGGQYTIDPEDEDTLYTIIKDGKTATFEDLEEGDVVSVIGAGKANVVFYVSTNKVEGAVTRKSSGDDPKYTIDGSQYEAKDGITIDVADEGTFYLNVDGTIVYKDATSDATGNYGYLVASDVTDSFGKQTWTLEFVDENGNDVTAKLAARVRVGEGKVGSTSVKSEEIGTAVDTSKDSEDLQKAKTLFQAFATQPQLFKYDTNSAGEITKIIIAKDGKVDKEFCRIDGYDEDATTYAAKTNRAGKFEFDDDTVVFNVKVDDSSKAQDPTKVDADDVTVSTIKALFKDGEFAPAFAAYDQKSSSKVVGAVVTYGAASNVDASEHVVIVTSVSATKFGDSNGVVIEGLQDGKAVSFNVCDEEESLKTGSFDPENLEKGDVIMVAEGIEYVTNIEMKANLYKSVPVDKDGDGEFDKDAKGNVIYETVIDLASDDSGFYNVAKSRTARDTLGTILDRDNNDITITEYDYDAKTSEFNVSGARFTLVGITGANTVVKNSSVGAINVNKYNYKVYIRYYDDDCMDVVFFELSAK